MFLYSYIPIVRYHTVLSITIFALTSASSMSPLMKELRPIYILGLDIMQFQDMYPIALVIEI